MGKGPGMFSDIGKKARDLLTKDYTYDQKFTVSTYSEDGLGFTSTGGNKGGLFIGDINAQYKYQNSTFDVKVDTNSNISTTITIDDVIPHAKTVLSFKFPDEKSGKLELQYLHEHAGFRSSFGLNTKPVIDFSGAVGSEVFTVGGEVGYDTTSGLFTKYNAGIGITKPEFSAAIILADKGDTLKASYVHAVNPLAKTHVAAEISRRFSANQNTFTVGSSYALDPLTTMKTRLNNHGKLGALLQHEWKPKSLVALSGEFDTKALDKSPKIGVALALKP
uniref:TSA: Wollemia nobilis Ref_Wollemi_Transcript_22203_1555 transcribed RNA sequence n=1 Tax=Wollemia nobilis TaxID=56998 RepID=A0A0C9QMH8_9CONI